MEKLTDFVGRSDASIDDAIVSIKYLSTTSSKKGKENASGNKDVIGIIQQCLKAAQKRLTQPKQDVHKLATLCQYSLRFLEQSSASMKSLQLQTAAYSTIRMLVSAKAFAPALQEALKLHQSLCKQYQVPDAQSDSKPVELSSDVLNLVVGSVLTMAMCWGEGAAKTSEQFAYVLQVAESSQSWFSLLPSEEASKHSQSLFKSLYRGSAKLLEGKNWQYLEAACSAMVLAADHTPACPLVFSAISKLTPHAPEPFGVSMLTSALLSSSLQSCISSEPESGTNVKEMMVAALPAANLLRKRVATLMSGLSSAEDVVEALGSSDSAFETAEALDIAASVIAIGHSLDASSFTGYGHSAAVSLACAARIRAASVRLGEHVVWEESTAMAAWKVLGWQWPDFPDELETLLSSQELTWLSSSFFNVGIELLGCSEACTAIYEGACEVLKVALAAMLTSLLTDDKDAGPSLSQLSHDIGKRTSALIEALGQAGRPSDCVSAAADALAIAFSVLPEFPTSAVSAIASAVVRQQILSYNGGLSNKTTNKRGKAATTTKKQGSSKATKAASNSSLTAAMQAHDLELDEDIINVIARAELTEWAAELSGPGGIPVSASAEAAAAEAAEHMLMKVYPAKAAPLDHARTLILLHSLDFKAGLEEGESNLDRAAAVLGGMTKKASSSAAARALTALISAQQTLDGAQKLIQEALKEQDAAQKARQQHIQNNPSDVHRDDAGVDAVVGALSSLNLDTKSIKKWGDVMEQAQQAMELFTTAIESVECCELNDSCVKEDLSALATVVQELSVLLGIRGVLEDEATLQKGLVELKAALGSACEESNGGCCLQECVLPALSTVSSAAEVESESTELAISGGRSPAVVLRRAELSMVAALGHAAQGATVPALHCAGEAHRLLSSLLHQDSNGSLTLSTNSLNKTSSSNGDRAEVQAGWWQLATTYCKSLLLVGRLFESSGMADEALSALKEGQKLAEAMGSSLLSSAFSSQLALIWARMGQTAAAERAVQNAQSLLETAPEPAVESATGQWIQATLACAQVKLHLAAGECTQALLSCHAALDACQALAEAASEDMKPHVQSALALALYSRVESLKSEGNSLPEVAKAAGDALQQLDIAASATFAAAATAALMLAQAAPEIELARPGVELSAAHLWAPGQFNWELGAAGTVPGPKSTLSTESAALCWAGNSKLWRSFAYSRGAPYIHRIAASKLAPACAAAGLSQLSALLLHLSAGSTLQLQHKLVLYSRQKNLQRLQRANKDTCAASESEAVVKAAMEVLDSELDWDLILNTLCKDVDSVEAIEVDVQLEKVTTKRGGSRRGGTAASKAQTASAAASTPSEDEILAALTTINIQAASLLNKWLSALPQGTTVCSVGSRNIAIADQVTGKDKHQNCLVISRFSADSATPLIIDVPIQPYGAADSNQHPIRALALDDESTAAGDSSSKSNGASGSAVTSAVQEMNSILQRSTHSMKQMALDTREEQREWWRTRVDLDDSLAALLQHVDAEWLGPWKCLLLGPPEEEHASTELRQRAEKAVEQLAAGAGAVEENAKRAVQQLAMAILPSVSTMSSSDLKKVATMMCNALAGGEADKAAVTAAIKILRDCSVVAVPVANEPTKAADADIVAPLRRVKFADDAVEETSPPQTLRRSAAVLPQRDADALNGASNLCAKFDSLSVASTPLPARTPGAVTLRAQKSRSRLAMMQTATPAGPRSTVKRPPLRSTTTAPVVDENAGSRFAATAPRPPRPFATPAAARTVPIRPRSAAASTSGPNGAPVIAVFHSDLQSLPWESLPGLSAQRIYRLPSLPCAAAAITTTNTAVDLSSVYYTVNPSGDLLSTQDTFETWFKSLQGWDGCAGCPPSAAELASALQSRHLFVYCGHGGGEQYIPPARLRGLSRCAAALLMGCSSGRLSGGEYYEPTGVVLAYLLAGCPSAVANLWDVTDRDIDRFAQAVLTRWLSNGGGGDGGEKDQSAGAAMRCVASAVDAARAACKLQHLIGAAPVTYGVPTKVAAVQQPERKLKI